VQISRTMESKLAQKLGFDKRTEISLRQAFERLDPAGNGVMTFTAAEKAVGLMGWNIKPQKLRKIIMEADQDDSGKLDYSEFLQFMRSIEEEIAAQPQHVPLMTPTALAGETAAKPAAPEPSRRNMAVSGIGLT